MGSLSEQEEKTCMAFAFHCMAVPYIALGNVRGLGFIFAWASRRWKRRMMAFCQSVSPFVSSSLTTCPMHLIRPLKVVLCPWPYPRVWNQLVWISDISETESSDASHLGFTLGPSRFWDLQQRQHQELHDAACLNFLTEPHPEPQTSSHSRI